MVSDRHGMRSAHAHVPLPYDRGSMSRSGHVLVLSSLSSIGYRTRSAGDQLMLNERCLCHEAAQPATPRWIVQVDPDEQDDGAGPGSSSR